MWVWGQPRTAFGSISLPYALGVSRALPPVGVRLAADGTTLRCLLKGWRGDGSNWQAFVAPVNHSLKIGKKSPSQLACAVLTLGVTCFQHFCIDKSQERKRGVFSWVEDNKHAVPHSLCVLFVISRTSGIMYCTMKDNHRVRDSWLCSSID